MCHKFLTKVDRRNKLYLLLYRRIATFHFSLSGYITDLKRLKRNILIMKAGSQYTQPLTRHGRNAVAGIELKSIPAFPA